MIQVKVFRAREIGAIRFLGATGSFFRFARNTYTYVAIGYEAGIERFQFVIKSILHFTRGT